MVSGTRDNPPPELPWASNFSLCRKIQTTVYMKDPELSREGETTRVDEFSRLGR